MASATVITRNAMIDATDVITAKVANISDIALNQAVAFTYPELTAGTGNVSKSGTTLTAATSGSFAKVQPGATIIHDPAGTPTTLTVVSKTSDTVVVVAESGTLSAGTWNFTNPNGVVAWKSDNSRGYCNGVSLDSFDQSVEGSKAIQIKLGGTYNPNTLSTEDVAAGSITVAIIDALQNRGLFAVERVFNEF